MPGAGQMCAEVEPATETAATARGLAVTELSPKLLHVVSRLVRLLGLSGGDNTGDRTHPQ